MKAKKLPPLKLLKTILKYEPKTGKLYWLVGRRKGLEAGHVKEDGYRTIVIAGAHYGAHRLAWVLSGKPTVPFVGHKNKNRDDNRICNLMVSPRCPKRRNKNSSRNSKRA